MEPVIDKKFWNIHFLVVKFVIVSSQPQIQQNTVLEFAESLVQETNNKSGVGVGADIKEFLLKLVHWHKRLILYTCSDCNPIWVLVHILAAPLLIQLLAYALGKQAKDTQTLGALYPGGEPRGGSRFQITQLVLSWSFKECINNERHLSLLSVKAFK